jgi:predicted transcriptional regulator
MDNGTTRTIPSAVLGEFMADVQTIRAEGSNGIAILRKTSPTYRFAREWVGKDVAEYYSLGLYKFAKAERAAKVEPERPKAKRQRSDSAARDLRTLALVAELEIAQERPDVALAVNFLAIRLDCSTSTASKILRRLLRVDLLLPTTEPSRMSPRRWKLTQRGRTRLAAEVRKAKDLKAGGQPFRLPDANPSRLEAASGRQWPITKDRGQDNHDKATDDLRARPVVKDVLKAQSSRTAQGHSSVLAASALNSSGTICPSLSRLSQVSSHAMDGFKTGGRRGDTDADVWLVLSQEPQSAEAIRAKADKARATVFESLRALAKKDLAAKAKGGWIRGPKTPEQVAWEHRTLGKTEGQRKRRVANSSRNRKFWEKKKATAL